MTKAEAQHIYLVALLMTHGKRVYSWGELMALKKEILPARYKHLFYGQFITEMNKCGLLKRAYATTRQTGVAQRITPEGFDFIRRGP